MLKIADIIKYEGDNSTFVWKHPCEDFNSYTQLIVHEGQEAIVLLEGKALDTFGPGRHVLKNKNIPILSDILKRCVDSETPFHCEVYFFNKAVQMSIKWGTDSKVRFIEPTMNFPIEIGAYGELNLAVSNAYTLLVKLVGTMNGVSWEERGNNFTQSLQASFRPLISTAVKTYLGSSIKAKEIDILEIDEYLEELSAVLREKMLPGFEEYGLTIPQFYISSVLLPENDPNFKQFKDLHSTSLTTKVHKQEAERIKEERDILIEAETTATELLKRRKEREVISAEADAAKIRIVGYADADVRERHGFTKADEAKVELEKATIESMGQIGANVSGGIIGDRGLAGELVGLQLGLMTAERVVSQAESRQQRTPIEVKEKKQSHLCSGCGKELPDGAKFCLECGTKVVILAEDEMLCPVCSAKIKKGKFCLECGAALIKKCQKCEKELPIGSKFCPECGEKL